MKLNRNVWPIHHTHTHNRNKHERRRTKTSPLLGIKLEERVIIN